MKYLLPLLFLCVSCLPEKEYDIEPELQPIVDYFFAEGRARMIFLRRDNLIVKWADLRQGVGGDSGKDGLQRQRVVRINRLYKDRAILSHIVFHELGHACLFRKHVNYQSIMNPQVSVSLMTPEYIDELFGVSYHPL